MSRFGGFDWSDGNDDKLWRQHGLTTEEVEEAFDDPDRAQTAAYSGPGGEPRRAVLGRTLDGMLLEVVYTRRGGLIRVVTAFEPGEGARRAYERNRRRRGGSRRGRGQP